MREGATICGRPIPSSKTIVKSDERLEKQKILKEQRELTYQERLVAGYLAKYEMVTKQMVNDYKIYAINAYLTERYCGQESEYKYSS